MKIALSGLKPDVHKEIIKQVQGLWPMYVSPIQTIFDEDADNEKLEQEANDTVKKVLADLNEFEKDNFLGWNLLYSQFEKYSKQKHIIYNGSPIDLFVSAMMMRGYEQVSDEYIEKVIRYLKKYLRKLDVVYWVPNETGTEELDEVDGALETLYNGIYNQYHNNFHTSPYFDHDYCPAFIRFDSTNYLEEMKYIIDHKGNLEGSEQSRELEDETKVKDKMARFNPELLNVIQEGERARKDGEILLQ